MGYTPIAVGNMTLDMVYMLLTKRDNLRHIGGRVKTVQSGEVASLVTDDGFVRGRDREGNPIKGKILGKSRAQIIREEAQKKRVAEAARKKAEENNPKRRRRLRK